MLRRTAFVCLSGGYLALPINRRNRLSRGANDSMTARRE
jgi:hypothetical protein